MLSQRLRVELKGEAIREDIYLVHDLAGNNAKDRIEHAVFQTKVGRRGELPAPGTDAWLCL